MGQVPGKEAQLYRPTQRLTDDSKDTTVLLMLLPARTLDLIFIFRYSSVVCGSHVIAGGCRRFGASADESSGSLRLLEFSFRPSREYRRDLKFS